MSPVFKETGLMRMEKHGLKDNEMRDATRRKREMNEGI